MREIDAETPVVWPAWCYSGSGGDQSGGINPGGAAPGGRQRQYRRRAPPTSLHNGAHDATNINNNNNNNFHATIKTETLHGTIKNERLSPQNATDRSSSRSRSVTPSTGSFPGTPPQSGGPGSAESGASPGHPHPALLTSHAPPQQLARNYSDFMRSLAAKYNNPNTAEFFPGSRPMVANGFPASVDPRYALKTAPFTGLLVPPPSVKVPPQSSPPLVMADVKETSVRGLFAGYSFAHGGPKNVPAFPPMMDMTSTKALLAIARVANAAKEVEMSNNFVKSATKRPPGLADNVPLSSPLDLSSATRDSIYSSSAAKKSRLSPKIECQSTHGLASPSGSVSCGDSGDASPGMDCKSNISDSAKNDSKNNEFKCEKNQRLSVSRERAEPASPASSGCCRNESRRDFNLVDPEIASWSVDDVCKFVESIDICAEYSPVFREQRIDGSGLPLLTEEHLTGLLKMKLGPALKMKALLAGKLGNNCHQCRCQQSTPTPTTGPLVSGSPRTASPNTSSSSTSTTLKASGSPVIKYESDSSPRIRYERSPSTDRDNSNS